MRYLGIYTLGVRANINDIHNSLKMAADISKLRHLSKDELLKYIESLSEQLNRYEIRFRGKLSSGVSQFRL